ncbi:hypothetical protein KCP77_19900 [Salmonella enterica subsp. enterica]|nr:hypothetical protein KCP77_19900 [Salmonella enterica subsp. enterica]
MLDQDNNYETPHAVVVFGGDWDSTPLSGTGGISIGGTLCHVDYGLYRRAGIPMSRALAALNGARPSACGCHFAERNWRSASLTRIRVPDYEPNADGIPNTFITGTRHFADCWRRCYQVKAEAVIAVCGPIFPAIRVRRDEFNSKALRDRA